MREYTFDEIVVLITMDETTGEETRSRSYASIASVRGSETYQAIRNFGSRRTVWQR